MGFNLSHTGSSYAVSSDKHSEEANLHLLDDSHSVTDGPRRRHTRGTLALYLCLAAVGLLWTIGILYTSITVQHLATHPDIPIRNYGDCGSNNSTAEARAKGCIFDPMGWIWVQPQCFDQDLMTDFLNRTDFTWHTEPKLTPESKVPMEEIMRGDHTKLFTQKKYHYVHCTYMWKRMHKAVLNDLPIDSYLLDWHHTGHCEMVLLNDWLHEDVSCTPEMVCPTWVRATWTSCLGR